ncbi:MAG: hypothetical protein BWY77_01646 [bacterium ADurb.Bin431]|nr:MAG: hypothetical protein BWY77_01646 [bacterium ADurb.Bin431]
MSGAGIVEPPFLGIDDHIKKGDEHPLFHVCDDKVVHARQHLGRILDAARLGAQGSADHGHDQRTRNPLARNIGDDDAQGILVHLDEIIIVASHLLGGGVIAADSVTLDLGKFARQQGLLDFLGDLHLLLQPFLFGHIDLGFPQLQGDITEGLGDLADLGCGIDVHLVSGTGLSELFDPLGETPEGVHH